MAARGAAAPSRSRRRAGGSPGAGGPSPSRSVATVPGDRAGAPRLLGSRPMSDLPPPAAEPPASASAAASSSTRRRRRRGTTPTARPPRRWHYAGFGIRLGGSFIDGLIIVLFFVRRSSPCSPGPRDHRALDALGNETIDGDLNALCEGPTDGTSPSRCSSASRSSSAPSCTSQVIGGPTGQTVGKKPWASGRSTPPPVSPSGRPGASAASSSPRSSPASLLPRLLLDDLGPQEAVLARQARQRHRRQGLSRGGRAHHRRGRRGRHP